jgi:uncharacterized protein involved in exopolysaccharide biosynthesis
MKQTSIRRHVIVLKSEDFESRRQQAADPIEAPSLRDYWQVARKHQRKILVCFGAAVLISAIIAFSTTPTYTARTTLLIERKDSQIVNIKQVLSESADAEESSYYESQ